MPVSSALQLASPPSRWRRISRMPSSRRKATVSKRSRYSSKRLTTGSSSADRLGLTIRHVCYIETYPCLSETCVGKAADGGQADSRRLACARSAGGDRAASAGQRRRARAADGRGQEHAAAHIDDVG